MKKKRICSNLLAKSRFPRAAEKGIHTHSFAGQTKAADAMMRRRLRLLALEKANFYCILFFLHDSNIFLLRNRESSGWQTASLPIALVQHHQKGFF